MDLIDKIKTKAKEIGFSKVGITDTAPFSAEIQEYFTEWLRKGYNARMGYLEKNIEERLKPSRTFEGAKSIVSVAISYNPGWIEHATDGNLSVISKYALGYDYHKVVLDKLKLLLDFVVNETSGEVKGEIYCDAGPVMEKAIAERAGLGWIGKNTILITKEFGSWVFLGEIILDVELKKDSSGKRLCFDCNLCIESCPTKAIITPGIINASRCLSYFTTESRGEIPLELRDTLGNRVFGCDSCQEVCPFNKDVPETAEPLFKPQKNLMSMPLEKLIILASEEFSKRFRNSAIKRVKRNGLLQNSIVAMGNSGNAKFIRLLKRMSEELNPMLQEHSMWAIEKIVRSKE